MDKRRQFDEGTDYMKCVITGMLEKMSLIEDNETRREMCNNGNAGENVK